MNASSSPFHRIANLLTLPALALSLHAVPDGFQIVRFAGPPDVNYPAGLAVSPESEVFVSVDRNSSLDVEANRGKIVRCVDTDGDGVADQFNDFVPNIDSPRGSCFAGGTLYVVNPPFLTAFRDTTGDGVADQTNVLIKGLGFDLKFRGADHTSNGVRMGIDGWLYLAIGDYGFYRAEARDGSTAHLHGGGVMRVRPDGTELETVSVNTRNIYDIAISPTLDLFARDNTNDGKGWNTRLHHFSMLADHGYPRLYKNFPGEIYPPLADYGGGSGTGGYFIDEPNWPEAFNRKLYTCDFTTQKLYVHDLAPQEATFKVGQDVFHALKAIDLDVDGAGRMFVCDWNNGGYRFSGPDVGTIWRIVPPGKPAPAVPNLSAASGADLQRHVTSASAVLRIHAQREMLRRGATDAWSKGLAAALRNPKLDVRARVAALFTLKQLQGPESHAALQALLSDDGMREFALRALTDRASQLQGVDPKPFLAALQDANPRVRLQAVVGLARLGSAGAASAILPLVVETEIEPPPAGADPYQYNHILPHIARKAVVKLNGVSACLKALSNGTLRPAALACLQEMHNAQSVQGLVGYLDTDKAPDQQVAVLGALFRLYHRDKPWDGKQWWTTRPDDRGPYFEPVTWDQTDAIRAAIAKHVPKLDERYHADLVLLMRRNRIDPQSLGVKLKVDELLALIEARNPGSAAIEPLKDGALDPQRDAAVRLGAFRALERIVGNDSFKAQLEVLSHWADHESDNADFSRALRGFVYDPQMAHRPKMLREALKKPTGTRGRIVLMAGLNVMQSPLANDYMKDLVGKAMQSEFNNPEMMRAVAVMNFTTFRPQVEQAAVSKKKPLAEAAQAALKQLDQAASSGSGRPLAELEYGEAVTVLMQARGDQQLGEQLFARQGCIACHTLTQNEPQKGPYLGDAGAKWQRKDLIDSVLRPSAVVAQGFQTQWFVLNDEREIEGFVTADVEGEIEVRNVAGIVTKFNKAQIVKQGTRPNSMMPEGLTANMTVGEMASLLDFLQSRH